MTANGGAVAALTDDGGLLHLPPVVTTADGLTVADLVFVRAATVEPEPVSWLVPGFVPLGMLSDISADPGVGKSSIAASIAAAVTVGRVPLSTERREPADVVLVATEDALGATLVPRLRAEGADLDRVHLYDIRADQPPMSLPTSIAALEAVVRHAGAVFVGLDPAIEFMDPGLDSHKQQDVARFMGALNAMAQRTGAAVMTVRHWNKAVGISALHKAAGSIGFVGKARVAMTAAKDKESHNRVLAVTKSAVGSDLCAVTFDIVPRGGSSVVAWGERTTVTADDLVARDQVRRGTRGPTPDKREAARTFLLDLLADGMAMRKEEIVKAARKAGAGARTLIHEVARELKLCSVTVQGRPGWKLPADETPDGL